MRIVKTTGGMCAVILYIRKKKDEELYTVLSLCIRTALPPSLLDPIIIPEKSRQRKSRLQAAFSRACQNEVENKSREKSWMRIDPHG